MQRRLILANLLLLAANPAVSLAGEEPPPMVRCATPERGADLTGRWILTMPTGAQWHATFERDGRWNYVRLRSGRISSRGNTSSRAGNSRWPGRRTRR